MTDEMKSTYQQCIEFNKLYKTASNDQSQFFKEKYPDYQSETDEEGMRCILIMAFCFICLNIN